MRRLAGLVGQDVLGGDAPTAWRKRDVVVVAVALRWSYLRNADVKFGRLAFSQRIQVAMTDVSPSAARLYAACTRFEEVGRPANALVVAVVGAALARDDPNYYP